VGGATLVLLPGLDGTGDLFRPLLEVISADIQKRVISYPVDRETSYPQVVALLEQQLASEESVVLVGESYSGPVALRFAAAHPQRVTAVVLCASFICSPLPRWLRWMVTSFLFRISPPALALRQLMVGPNASDELVAEVRAAIKRVRPEVMARRLKDVFDLQCEDALRQCAVPVMYLRGNQDALVGRRSVDLMLRVKPDIMLCTIDGPHLLLQREPAAAWREIASMIGVRIPSPGPLPV
jgi:pimeloyl-ACP methyl ester carboxylesterase